MRYSVVTDKNPNNLNDQITMNLNAGWKLVGGIAVANLPKEDWTTSKFVWAQAMILNDESEGV